MKTKAKRAENSGFYIDLLKTISRFCIDFIFPIKV